MNFPMSVLTSCLIAGIIWLGVRMQSADEPTEFEKYSSVAMDGETMSNVGFSLVTFGREKTAEFFNLEGYKALAAADNKSATASAQQVAAPKVEQVQSAAVSMPQSKKSEEVPVLAPYIVGINKSVDLSRVGALWEEFSDQTALSGQLMSDSYTVFVVYSDFNAEFTTASVSIGYFEPSMEGNRIELPQGNRTELLEKGSHNASVLAGSWEKIDYGRNIKAVLERRDYSGHQESVTNFVIYQ